MFAVIGSFAVQNSVFDVYIMLGAGLVGYVFSKCKFNPAALILGLVLGNICESNLRRAVKLTQGDVINLGFTEADRVENIRRIAEVSKLFIDSGIITIAAFISPNNDIREMAANIIGQEDFYEVYVSTPLTECERRDVKGLYAKARRGEIKNFTGISAPFEAPLHPALTLDTSKLSLEESVNQLLDLILPKIQIKK